MCQPTSACANLLWPLWVSAGLVSAPVQSSKTQWEPATQALLKCSCTRMDAKNWKIQYRRGSHPLFILPVGTIRALKGWRAEISKTVETYRRGEVDWLVGCVPDGYIAQLVDSSTSFKRENMHWFAQTLPRTHLEWRHNEVTGTGWPKKTIAKWVAQVSSVAVWCLDAAVSWLHSKAVQFATAGSIPNFVLPGVQTKRETYSYRTAWFDFFERTCYIELGFCLK